MEFNDSYQSFLKGFVSNQNKEISKETNKRKESNRNICSNEINHNITTINFKTINTNNVNNSVVRHVKHHSYFPNKPVSYIKNTKRCDILYNMSIINKNKRIELVNKYSKASEDKFNQEHTFHPRLQSSSLSNNSILKKSLYFNKNIPISNSLYDDFIHCTSLNLNTLSNVNKTASKTNRLREELYNKEIEECSFKPKVNNTIRKHYTTTDCLVNSDAYENYIHNNTQFRSKKTLDKDKLTKTPGYGNIWKKGITSINAFYLKTNDIKGKYNNLGQSDIQSLKKPMLLNKYTNQNFQIKHSHNKSKANSYNFNNLNESLIAYTKLNDIAIAEKYLNNALDYLIV